MKPVLHLMVGLPGVGKTTVAAEISHRDTALRLTPDEWMIPLFGDSDADGKRDVLEGRLLWVAHEVLRQGGSVVVDFGCWSPDERHAIRAIADLVGADYQMHFIDLPEDERRERSRRRWFESPELTWDMSEVDQNSYLEAFIRPGEDERPGAAVAPVPAGFQTWPQWASQRWPSLPRLDERGSAGRS